MPAPTPRQILLASFAASAAWLGPWIVLLLFVSESDYDNAIGYGLLKAWSLWGIWDAPPNVRYEEAIDLSLASVLALGVTALPAAAAWWHLAIRPAAAADLTAPN